MHSKSPNQNIAQALAGTLPLPSLTVAEGSAIRLPIYLRAAAMLELPRAEMAKAAEGLPVEIRDLVREECKRLMLIRRQKKAR